MGQISKQLSIYICTLICCSPYTMIASFYPKIAVSKGIPLWVVGTVFSADPFCSLVFSGFLGKYMLHIGRKFIIVLSLVFACLSIFMLSPIQQVSASTLLILSFASRMFSGISTSCVMTAGDSVIVSDYPDNIETMIGRIEGSIGIGFIIGPLMGTLLYMNNLFYSLITFGIFILCFIPICWGMLGQFRHYEIHNEKINSIRLMLKPVNFYLENYFGPRNEHCFIVFFWIYYTDARGSFRVVWTFPVVCITCICAINCILRFFFHLRALDF